MTAGYDESDRARHTVANLLVPAHGLVRDLRGQHERQPAGPSTAAASAGLGHTNRRRRRSDLRHTGRTSSAITWGDYTNSMTQTYWATTLAYVPPIPTCRLDFWRWLGVNDRAADHAYIQYPTTGSGPIWTNGVRTSWTRHGSSRRLTSRPWPTSRRRSTFAGASAHEFVERLLRLEHRRRDG